MLKHLRELQESCQIGRYLQVQKGKWVNVKSWVAGGGKGEEFGVMLPWERLV